MLKFRAKISKCLSGSYYISYIVTNNKGEILKADFLDNEDNKEDDDGFITISFDISEIDHKAKHEKCFNGLRRFSEELFNFLCDKRARLKKKFRL